MHCARFPLPHPRVTSSKCCSKMLGCIPKSGYMEGGLWHTGHQYAEIGSELGSDQQTITRGGAGRRDYQGGRIVPARTAPLREDRESLGERLQHAPQLWGERRTTGGQRRSVGEVCGLDRLVRCHRPGVSGRPACCCARLGRCLVTVRLPWRWVDARTCRFSTCPCTSREYTHTHATHHDT